VVRRFAEIPSVGGQLLVDKQNLARFQHAESKSPFDSIMQTRSDGSEYWSARELHPMLGYDQWRRFEDAVHRAMMACQNSAHKASDHFVGAGKMVSLGSGSSRSVPDYHLTRYACYLVAMNGDPRKPEIAAAQTYFALQTYRQETAASPDHIPALQMNQQLIELCSRQATIIEQLIRMPPSSQRPTRRRTRQVTLQDLEDDLSARYITHRTGWHEDPRTGEMVFVWSSGQTVH